MTNYVNVYLESPDDGNVTSTTGLTKNVRGVEVRYVLGRVYGKLNDVSRKTLERHRDKAEQTIPQEDLKLYFTLHDGSYWYSDRFRSFRTYKPETVSAANQALPEYEITSADLLFHNDLKETLKNIPWTYFGGVRSKYGTLEISTCVANMREAFRQIRVKYPAAEVTMFYTTEHNDHVSKDPDLGYHSHCVLNIRGQNLVQVKREFERILFRCGNGTATAKTYNPREDGVGYITKFIRHTPDGWGVLSTSKSQIETIYERTTGRAWIVKANGEDWLEKA